MRHLDSVIHRDTSTLKESNATISSLRAEDDLRASALLAGQSYGVWLSSYNYQDLNSASSNFSKVEAHSDATFKQDFAKTSAGLAPTLTQYHAIANGQVLSEGVVSLTDTTAQLDMFIDQTVTNTVQKPNSVTQPLRVHLTLVRQDGQWLIDALEVPK